jgi:hypothetical protein
MPLGRIIVSLTNRLYRNARSVMRGDSMPLILCSNRTVIFYSIALLFKLSTEITRSSYPLQFKPPLRQHIPPAWVIPSLLKHSKDPYICRNSFIHILTVYKQQVHKTIFVEIILKNMLQDPLTGNIQVLSPFTKAVISKIP